jgi:hypothetical protein
VDRDSRDRFQIDLFRFGRLLMMMVVMVVVVMLVFIVRRRRLRSVGACIVHCSIGRYGRATFGTGCDRVGFIWSAIENASGRTLCPRSRFRSGGSKLRRRALLRLDLGANDVQHFDPCPHIDPCRRRHVVEVAAVLRAGRVFCLQSVRWRRVWSDRVQVDRPKEVASERR